MLMALSRTAIESVTYGLHHCTSAWREVLECRGIDRRMVRPNQYFYFDNFLRRVYLKDESLVIRTRKGDVLDYQDFYDDAIAVLRVYSAALVPKVESYFNRFSDKMRVILTGGGVNYLPVREGLGEMLHKMRYRVECADREKSLTSAAAGYRIAARQRFGATAVGLDIGNHNIVVLGGRL